MRVAGEWGLVEGVNGGHGLGDATAHLRHYSSDPVDNGGENSVALGSQTTGNVVESAREL